MVLPERLNWSVYFKGSNAKALAGRKELWDLLRASTITSNSASKVARTRTPGATS